MLYSQSTNKETRFKFTHFLAKIYNPDNESTSNRLNHKNNYETIERF